MSDTPSLSSQPSPHDLRVICEWEQSWCSSPVGAYVHTVKSIISNPIDYFATIRPFHDYLSLGIFIGINCFCTVFVSALFQLMMSVVFHPVLFFGLPLFAVLALIFPFIDIGVRFLIGALLHFSFVFLGSSQKEFSATMTVYGLSSAASLFGIVPILGAFIALVYTVIINTAGQAHMHEISLGRAILAFVFPIAVFLILILFCFLLVGLLIFLLSVIN